MRTLQWCWMVAFLVVGCRSPGLAPTPAEVFKTAHVNDIDLPYVEQGRGAPVLVTVGTQTRALWALAEAALQRCVPHGELVEIADSNHDAIVRHAEAFNRALLDFLDRH